MLRFLLDLFHNAPATTTQKPWLQCYERGLFLAIFISIPSIPFVSDANDRFSKLNTIYHAFGIEPDRSAIDQILRLEVSHKDFEDLLFYIDPNHQLQRYAMWDEKGLTMYQDRDSKQITDFKISFQPHADLKNSLEEFTPQNNLSQPLLGLRIALDPGHIGGKIWDTLSGKYLRDSKKHVVSEGVITLQTCLLLKRRLTQLGATVLMTRQTLTPVTPLLYQDFDLAPFAKTEFEAHSDDVWFDELLRHPLSGPSLIEEFQNNQNINNLYSEAYRGHYFFRRADLTDRAEKITPFNPHMSLVIHFDGGDEGFFTQKAKDVIRAYVVGNVLPGELASAHDRYLTLQHLLAPQRWLESKKLSAFLVKNLSKTLDLPLRKNPKDWNAIKVLDGVYARNLALNRAITIGIQSYLEVFCYNNVYEFKRLLHKDRSIEVDGAFFSYSSRLDEVAEGVVQGILAYVDSRKKNN